MVLKVRSRRRANNGERREKTFVLKNRTNQHLIFIGFFIFAFLIEKNKNNESSKVYVSIVRNATYNITLQIDYRMIA